MTPSEIANVIIEMRTGELGLYTGTLYGYPVKTSEAPIDRFLKKIADTFIGWDVIHPKFIEACKTELGWTPEIEEWSDLIADSDQMPQLKAKLLTIVGVPTDPAMKIPEGKGNYQLFFTRGTVVPVIHIEKSMTSEVYYAALKSGIRTTVANKKTKKGKSGRPSSFGKLIVDADNDMAYYEWCYGAIITFNAVNVWKVLDLEMKKLKHEPADVQAFLKRHELGEVKR